MSPSIAIIRSTLVVFWTKPFPLRPSSQRPDSQSILPVLNTRLESRWDPESRKWDPYARHADGLIQEMDPCAGTGTLFPKTAETVIRTRGQKCLRVQHQNKDRRRQKRLR